MLQVAYIKDNKEQVLEGLRKRNFKSAEESINSVLDLDQRKSSDGNGTSTVGIK